MLVIIFICAQRSADDTTEWRLNMWKNVLPQIPQYLILGKGYSFNAAELEVINSVRNGGTDPTAAAETVGDYHNGPLSVIIPFGLFGVFGFLWFMAAAIRVLHQNYKYGPPAYSRYNTLILAYFVAKSIF